MSRRLTLLLLAAGAALAAAAPARAADLDPCPQRPVSQVFARFLDPALYTLAAGGDLEDAGGAWALDGARVVAGNEPFFLHADGDARSLSLPAGASALSPENCVSIAHPTLRFMARSTGSPLGVLAVSAVVTDGPHLLADLPVGVVTGLGSAWAPSLPMVLTNGLTGSLLDRAVTVRFRFTVTGLGGAFQVDDVYIDPYFRG